MPPSKSGLQQIDNVFTVGPRDLEILGPLHDRCLVQRGLVQRKRNDKAKCKWVLEAHVMLANECQEWIHRYSEVINEFVDRSFLQMVMHRILLLPRRDPAFAVKRNKINPHAGAYKDWFFSPLAACVRTAKVFIYHWAQDQCIRRSLGRLGVWESKTGASARWPCPSLDLCPFLCADYARLSWVHLSIVQIDWSVRQRHFPCLWRKQGRIPAHVGYLASCGKADNVTTGKRKRTITTLTPMQKR